MGWEAAAIMGGASILGQMLAGDSKTTTEQRNVYSDESYEYKLPSGATVWLRPKIGGTSTSTTDVGMGDILGSALSSAGQAYAMGQAYDSLAKDASVGTPKTDMQGRGANTTKGDYGSLNTEDMWKEILDLG